MKKPLPYDIPPDALVDLHETAASWFTRRQEPGWTGADERALNQWLEADPLHREIFESMGHTRQLLDQLKQWQAAKDGRARAYLDTRTQQRVPATFVPPRQTSKPGIWHSFIRSHAFAPALAAACALLMGGGWFAWDQTPRYQLDVATAERETRSVDLPDGSHIDVNIATRMQVRYYPRRREVVLDRGEAFFKIAADANKPFTVDSARSRVTVVGTAFNVRAAPPQFVVKVLEGKIEVRPNRDDPQGPVLRLSANSGLAVDPATMRYQPVPAEAETVGDWRSGQLRFRSTPLGQVVQEVSRYLGKPVTLSNPALAQLQVSAFFATATPENFVELLPDLVPVRVQRQSNGGWLISTR